MRRRSGERVSLAEASRVSGPGKWILCWVVALSFAATPATAETSGELKARTLFVATGEAAGDHLGWAAVGVGDVNGDGYDDVLVGAFGNDAGGPNAGRAYLFHGGPGADGVADLVLTGHGPEESFGWSVGSAGDVNGDSFPDLIVGTRYANRAYVYFGGPAADSVADKVLAGYGGHAVSGVGDFNDDGYDDVIVGRLFTDSAYVYYGGPSMDDVPDRVLTSQRGWGVSSFGYAVGAAGDVNSDGYADILVGAPLENGDGFASGRAYVFYGGAPPDTVADLILSAVDPWSWYGFSVATGGDVNGDNHADPVVGTYGQGFQAGPGRVHVYLNRPIGEGTDVHLIGEEPLDRFGSSVGTAGDVNADGYSDLVIGAPLNDAGGTNAGRAYVYLGGAVLDSMPDLILTGQLDSGFFGRRVGTAGDVNGDGFSDLIIGAHGEAEDAGRAYVVLVSPATVGVDASRGRWALSGARPNPARRRVSLDVELAAPDRVTAEVYDTAGRRVEEMTKRKALPAGRTVLTWEAGSLAKGLYLIRVRIGGREETRKVVWLGE